MKAARSAGATRIACRTRHRVTGDGAVEGAGSRQLEVNVVALHAHALERDRVVASALKRPVHSLLVSDSWTSTGHAGPRAAGNVATARRTCRRLGPLLRE